MNRLIDAAIILIVAGLLWWAAGILPLPHPLGVVIQVLVIVGAIIALLQLLRGVSIIRR